MNNTSPTGIELTVCNDITRRQLFEENDNNDMGRVITASDAIARALQCTVALVAHPGKDASKGMRGGSALLGGLDTVIQLEKNEDGLRTWKIEKQKEGEDGLTGCFKLTVVPIDTDEDGDEITSAVVVESDDVPGDIVIKENKSLAGYRKYFESSVLNAGRFDGKLNAPFVSSDAWNEYSKTRPHESDGARKTYLSKAKKALVDAGYVQESFGGYVALDHDAFVGAWVGLPKF